MTDTQVWEAMIGWIAETTGLTTIKAHQGAEPPAKPYAMVNLVNSREVRRHEQNVTFSETEGQVSAEAHIETEWFLSVHTYGDNPTEPLRKLRTSYRIPGAIESIAPLTIHEFGRINRVPEAVKNQWDERGQCNLFVRGMVSESAEIDVIETAPINFPDLP